MTEIIRGLVLQSIPPGKSPHSAIRSLAVARTNTPQKCLVWNLSVSQVVELRIAGIQQDQHAFWRLGMNEQSELTWDIWFGCFCYVNLPSLVSAFKS
jgi:hypothetical protein